ncbi:hypothetical protein F0U44_04730 [Nocardioides humilatus]|uniref:Galactose oxidase n=1 Tax=Nocardioides humilatus TaxID=2607660 RepID=A0A5B1LPL1_9ACTN|nr:hypothetical protein [Nocardioides humilatus]KAA1421589.1 hypothetical protein F0U44_04730 [Nocardioides humilatus]
MNLEERLTTALREDLDRLDASPGDPHPALVAGSRIIRRRTTLRVVTTVAAVGAVTLTTGIALRPGDRSDDQEPAPAPRVGGWTKAARSPLTPRYAPLMAWTGDDVLVIGGHQDTPCPPTADCAQASDPLSDAAAYNPHTDTWRTIAAPPLRVDSGTPAVVSDGVVVTGNARDWWTYDPGADRWNELYTPATVNAGPWTELDGKVYAVNSARTVSVLDVATGSWSTLPSDDLAPALTVDGLFATPAGIVLAGVNYDEAAPDEPTLTQADIWDGESWSRLPRTGMIGWLYYWTGERIIGIEPGSADGGQTNNWGRSYPAAGALDPATGKWEPVPGLDYEDRATGPAWSVEAADGPLVATQGRVFDDTTRTWTEPGIPDSAVDSNLTATWADGRLVFFGGYDLDAQQLSSETWIWTPGAEPQSSPPTTAAQEAPVGVIEDLSGQWRLLEAEIDGEQYSPARNAGVELVVHARASQAFVGCELVGLRPRVDGDEVSLRPAAKSGFMLSCPPFFEDSPVSSGLYFDALRSVERGERDGRTLVLTGRDIVLTFQKHR